MKMNIQDLKSPVAANQLAAGAFFCCEMTTHDSTSLVATNQLAADIFLVKMGTQDLTSAGAFCFSENDHPYTIPG